MAASGLDLAQDRDTLNETGQLSRSVEQIAEAPPFPDIPLTLLCAAPPMLPWLTSQAELDARVAGQRRLAALSPRGRRVVTAGSGHFPNYPSRSWRSPRCATRWRR